MISGTAALGGVATSRPVSVKLTWTTGAGGAGAALSLVCSAPGSPTTYTPYSIPAGRLAAGESYSWGGEIERGATCQVRIAAPAGSQAVLNGAISVCGSQVKTWSDNGAASQTVDFTATSTACAADSCSGVVSTAGVGRVDVAYTPLLPGSAFVEEAPLAGEVLHLPFEESAGSTGPFRDAAAGAASGGGRDATCSGSACPSPGQAGHSGSAALFDGVNDSVRVPQVAGQGTTNYLTTAAWIYPTKRSDGSWNRGTLISRYGQWAVACTSDGLVRWLFRNTNPGWSLHSTGYVAPLNRWTHIVVVYDNGVDPDLRERRPRRHVQWFRQHLERGSAQHRW